jgi:hypothetical protein
VSSANFYVRNYEFSEENEKKNFRVEARLRVGRVIPSQLIGSFTTLLNELNFQGKNTQLTPASSTAPVVPQIRVEAAYLYDAVHLYADALIDCLENGKQAKNGTEIINAIKGRSYQSAMGYEIMAKSFVRIPINEVFCSAEKQFSGPHRRER